jgi:hypothetical protein
MLNTPPSGVPTSKDVLNALYNIPSGFDADGAAPPLTYGGEGKPNPDITCYFLIKIDNGQYVRADDNKAICPVGS